MMNKVIAIHAARVALAGLALASGLTFAASGAVCPWGDSATVPVVNQKHVFCGEINKKGKAVGFHSRPGGTLPATVQVTDDTVIAPTTSTGIYEMTKFDILDGNQGPASKTRSTMFPDSCSHEQVLAAIVNAASGNTTDTGKFTGSSGSECTVGGKAFAIEGWLLDGKVNTAYPSAIKP